MCDCCYGAGILEEENEVMKGLLQKIGIEFMGLNEQGGAIIQAKGRLLFDLGLVGEKEGYHGTITGVVSPEDEEKEKKDLHNRNDV